MSGARRRRGRSALAALVLAAGALGATATDGEAAVSCARDGVTLEVLMSAPGDGAALSIEGEEIVVAAGEGGDEVDCTGATPTRTSIDLVRVSDPSANGATEAQVQEPQLFEPGATSYGDGGVNAREIEFRFDLGGGDDLVDVWSTLLGDNGLVGGSEGVNWNTSPSASGSSDVDATLGGVDRLFLRSAEGDAIVSAAGGFGTGSPLEIPTQLDAAGLGQNATESWILGGAGPDEISAGYSVDGVDAGSGADAVDSYSGRGEIDLGPGDDRLRTMSASVLRVVSRASGGPGDDLLAGGSLADVLSGGAGRDTLLGGGGADRLLARDGTRDVRIACGAGNDAARIDRRFDPNPRSC